MSRGKARRDAGRPRTHARLVYEDWPGGVWVRGWETVFREYTYLVYVKVFSGATLCTRTIPTEWWSFQMGDKKNAVHTTYVQKALATKAGGPGGSQATDADLSAACPALHEFLTLSRLPDGTARQTSTISLFVEGSLWKAVLNERESNLVLWATGESLQGLWSELEARLTAEVVDWRPGRRQEPQMGFRGVDKTKKGR